MLDEPCESRTLVYIALGSNLGDRYAHMARAREALAALPLTHIVAESDIEETDPIGPSGQGPYLNQMIAIDTALEPLVLLDKLQEMERAEGRERVERWGPRTLDLDIVRFGTRRIADARLIVPHPELPHRDFWHREVAQLDARVSAPDANVMTAQQTVGAFVAKGRRGEKLVVVTAYDALFARLVAESGVDAILVGDSVGNTMAGFESTLQVTLDQMIYHAAAVRRGAPQALVVVDMPFLTYQVSVEQALQNCGRLIQQTGAQTVKLEGGTPEIARTVAAIVALGVPVMGHIGHMPQSGLVQGWGRVQGREPDAAARLVAEARRLEDAGAFAVVLELVSAEVAARVTEAVTIPTIGIGAGVRCTGQVLVLPDLLGLTDTFTPKFLKRYAQLADTVRGAVRAYAANVRGGTYPDAEHSF